MISHYDMAYWPFLEIYIGYIGLSVDFCVMNYTSVSKEKEKKKHHKTRQAMAHILPWDTE